MRDSGRGRAAALYPRRSASALRWGLAGHGSGCRGDADPAEGPGRQPALTGSLAGRALPGAPCSAHPTCCWAAFRAPQPGPAPPRRSPPATPAALRDRDGDGQ